MFSWAILANGESFLVTFFKNVWVYQINEAFQDMHFYSLLVPYFLHLLGRGIIEQGLP